MGILDKLFGGREKREERKGASPPRAAPGN